MHIFLQLKFVFIRRGHFTTLLLRNLSQVHCFWYSMTAAGSKTPALTYKIIAECKDSKARTSLMTLPHCVVETPVFMPVGTKLKFVFIRRGHFTTLLLRNLSQVHCFWYSMTAAGSKTPALTYKIIAECKDSKARTSLMTLPHCVVETPVFMPVGTKGSLKGLLPDQLESMDCQILLGNTYHLGTNPGPELLKKAGGLHKFMGWDRALLTDSGGFQMVSLLSLAEIKEEGVHFKSPYDDSSCLLSPENSIKIQNAIGADIIMQLDDVVSSLTTGPRVEEAMERTIRWLDRCINAHDRDDEQNIFPIVQGGLDNDLRKKCVAELIKRNVRGFAVGGISGGEAKDDFWRVVNLCSDLLPKEKPRYCMGVGFAADLVVCVALGIDMFDCVFPTRTARFGCGLVETGQINLKNKKFIKDLRPVQEGCECSTCKTYTRAYIHSIVTVETVACSLLSVHNVYYQLKLMKDIRESIKGQRFPEFVQQFMKKMFENREIPTWITDALSAVNIKVA